MRNTFICVSSFMKIVSLFDIYLQHNIKYYWYYLLNTKNPYYTDIEKGFTNKLWET